MMQDFSHIQGLLFDKDGTLIDLSASWLQPIKDVTELIARHADDDSLALKLLLAGGYDPQIDGWAQDSMIAFDSSEALLNHWAMMTSPELIESLLPDIRRIILEALRYAVPIIDGIVPLFDQLNTHYILGVASMDDEQNVRQTTLGLGIHERLSFYCGADSGHGVKPGPGMVLGFCQEVGLEPAQVAVIGDSNHDLNMARAAGSLAVGVLSGGSREATLRDQADLLLADISQLYTMLPLNARLA